MLPTTKALGEGLLTARRDCLARAITLIESSNQFHSEQAAHLLEYITHNRRNDYKNDGIRIGIAGPPGAGKVTSNVHADML
jgi:LAO/AO transport system kinase